jgi:signal transduction histidine kinase/CheY-like chemotaxis protein
MPLAVAGLFGASIALGLDWLLLSDRLRASWAAAEGPHQVTSEELAFFGVTIAALALLALALLRRGRRAIAERDAELAAMTWRLDFALEASEVGFWDVDLEADRLTWDDRAQALFGVSPRAGYFSEADWIGAIHPEDRERARATADTAVARGERFVSDYRVLWPDGQVRHLRDMAAFHVAPDGTRRLSGLVWDVTTDKERARELEQRRREAEAATVAKSNFLAAISHEIRTPLAGVIGMLELMLAEPLPPAQGKRARIADSSARTLLQLLNDVLDFSKLEAAAVALHPVPVRPAELIREVTDLMTARATQKGLALVCSVAPDMPDSLMLDPVRVRQVLTNIVSNAIAFTETGRVAVAAHFQRGPGGEALAVTVEDTGPGIPAADRERIFERFVQADSSFSRRAGGTGLGLAIARQLVELMGGTITVDSVEGEGSRFRFTVAAPRALAPAVAPPRLEASVPPPPLRILVAEDNPTNRYLIEALLAPGGHSVTVVPDGAAAVEAVGAEPFDLVLMDVQMPRMDGPTATRAIRALPGPAGSIPIVALTASVLPGDRERYAAAGMTDYVAKPIDRAALHAALARAAAAGVAPTTAVGT